MKKPKKKTAKPMSTMSRMLPLLLKQMEIIHTELVKEDMAAKDDEGEMMKLKREIRRVSFGRAVVETRMVVADQKKIMVEAKLEETRVKKAEPKKPPAARPIEQKTQVPGPAGTVLGGSPA